MYSPIKPLFQYEHYLNVLDIRKFRHFYASFRTSFHTLDIEKGRLLILKQSWEFVYFVVKTQLKMNSTSCSVVSSILNYVKNLSEKFYKQPA